MEETLKKFLDKNPIAKICILDNNSVEFLNKLKTKGISTTEIFRNYDVVIIPFWVLEEINDSEFRVNFIQQLIDNDVSICKVDEKEYVDLVGGEQLNLLKIVLSSVTMFKEIQSYIYKSFIGSRNLEDIQY